MDLKSLDPIGCTDSKDDRHKRSTGEDNAMTIWVKGAALAVILTPALAIGPVSAGPVSSDDLLGAQANSSDWLMYGRNYENQRYSTALVHRSEIKRARHIREQMMDFNCAF